MQFVSDIGIILYSVVGPLFVIMIVGAILERKFSFDVRTLSKINFFVLIPAVLFTVFVQAEIAWDRMSMVALFQICLIGSLFLLSWTVSRMLKLTRSKATAFVMGASFSNSGNFGIPLVTMVFAAQSLTAVSYQSVTVLVQNLLTFTLGVLVVGQGSRNIGSSLKQMLKMPLLYAIVLAAVLRAAAVPVEEIPILWIPVSRAAEGLIVIAMITVGIQLSKITHLTFSKELISAAAIKLLAGPLIALALVGAFGLRGLLAQLLVISAAAPSSVNTALLGVEYENEPDLAASIVCLTTVASAVTVSAAVLLVTRSGL